jgi:hypothetical protein
MTSEEVQQLGHVSTYYVYHEGEKHFSLLPTRKPPQEKKARKNEHRKQHDDDESVNFETVVIADRKANDYEKTPVDAENAQGYFVHQPYVSFHKPPRTLRRGTTKDAPPICLMHNSTCWKKWKLQFAEGLASVIDERGVVREEYNDDPENKDDKALKGYKVRSWRLWGESGKKYHREVNSRRNQAEQRQENVKEDWDTISTTSLPIDSYVPTLRGVQEVVYLSWMSPLSKDTRCYHFRYAGLDFYWKGTHIESDGVYSGVFLRHNHLKLIVQIPKCHYTQQSDGEERNYSESGLCLAKYTSSINPEMAGTLEIFESAASVLQDYIPFDDNVEPVGLKTGSFKRLSICEILLATAVCMIIGEYQKRMWVKGVFWGLVGAGVGEATYA